MFRLLLFLPLFLLNTYLFATHNIAGEITYRSISDTSPTYEITIKTWTYASSPAARDSLELLIYECDSLTPVYRNWILRDSTDTLHAGLGIEVRWYILEAYTFPEYRCYRLCMTDPNRGQNIINIINSVNVPLAFEATIHADNVPPGEMNSSPVIPASAVASARPFETFVQGTLLFDPDGDALFVHLVEPFSGCGMPAAGYSFPDDVMFSTSGYPNDFTIGGTGYIEWDMPTIAGTYQVGIVVEEYRGPKRLGAIYRDMQIIVTHDSLALGTQAPQDLQIQVWPNPAFGYVVLTASNQEEIDYKILNLQGQVVYSGMLYPGKREQIVTRFWPEGVYVVRTEDALGHRSTVRFVKVKAP